MTALGRHGLICILVTMVGVPIGFLCYIALAQGPAEPGSEPGAELIGGSAFAKEGTEVGEVSAVTVGGDGQIKEVRVTATLPLGLGERTVVVERGSFIALRGAVILELSTQEFEALLACPTVLRGTAACRTWHRRGGDFRIQPPPRRGLCRRNQLCGRDISFRCHRHRAFHWNQTVLPLRPRSQARRV